MHGFGLADERFDALQFSVEQRAAGLGEPVIAPPAVGRVAAGFSDEIEVERSSRR